MKKQTSTKLVKGNKAFDCEDLFTSNLNLNQQSSEDPLKEFRVRRTTLLAAKQVLDFKRMTLANKHYDKIEMFLEALTPEKIKNMSLPKILNCIGTLSKTADDLMVGGVAVSVGENDIDGNGTGSMTMEELQEKRKEVIKRIKEAI